MPLSTLIQQTVSKDELSFVEEGLNLYQQNTFLESLCSPRDKWSKNIMREDFLGRDAQNKDYLLALLSQGAYHHNWRDIHGIE